FWGDLLDTPETGDLPAVHELPILMEIRARAAVGPQHGAFDHPDVVGFSREGIDEIPGSGCAVILSDRMAAEKTLYVGQRHAGQEWECIIGGHASVRVTDDGTLTGAVSDGGLSVYVPRV
ncbi:MAG: alpha-amylase, partial [Schaalia odontolytica]